MTTNNSVNVGLSGSTGSGNFAGSTSPSFTTPTLGAATATSLAFSPTTGNLIGTTVADNASSGTVGEYISSNVTGVSMTSATPSNITSISLTAGDWDVNASMMFTPAVTTSITEIAAAISTTTNTLPDGSLDSLLQAGTLASASAPTGYTVPYQRINVSSTTTVYLVGDVTFSTSTCTAAGLLAARRMR